MSKAYSLNRASRKSAAKRPSFLRFAALYVFCSLAIYATSAAGLQAAGQDVKQAGALIPDATVVDQDGKRLRFYSDLVRGKAFVVNFVYTDCKAVCPMQANSFYELQTVLGDRLGHDVILISVSADPEVDTPGRLKSWGAAHKAKPGWRLLTGERSHIDELTKALVGDVARKGEHSPVALVGHGDVGSWKRAYGLAEPAKLVKLIDEMISKAESRAR